MTSMDQLCLSTTRAICPMQTHGCIVSYHLDVPIVQIIAFWFEYLTRERLTDSDDVLLVPGSISYLLANSGAL